MPTVSVEIILSWTGRSSSAKVVVEASREALLIAAAKEFKLEPKEMERAGLFCIDMTGDPIELADAEPLSDGDTIVMTAGELPVPHISGEGAAQKANYRNGDEVVMPAVDPPTPPEDPIAAAACSEQLDPWALLSGSVSMPLHEKRIFLLRHGQGEHNATRKYEMLDPPLTALGRDQADSWAVEMPKIARPEVVLFSPLMRTLQTGLCAFQHCSARFEVCRHAREYSFWEGCNKPTEDLTVTRRLLESLPRGHEILALDGMRSHTGIPGTGGLQEGITELPETAWDSTLHGEADRGRFYADADRVHNASFKLLRKELCQREENTIAVSMHAGVMRRFLGIDAKNCELVEAVLNTQTGQLTRIESYECPLDTM
jgi:broad specificity phosphatase PhoE